MSTEDSGNGMGRIPQWAVPWIMRALFGFLTIAVSFLLRALDQRLVALETQMSQQQMYRQHMTDFEAQYMRDQAAVIDSQRLLVEENRQLREAVTEHERQTRARFLRRNDPKWVPQYPGSPVLVPQSKTEHIQNAEAPGNEHSDGH